MSKFRSVSLTPCSNKCSNRIPRADPNFVPPSAAQQIIENPYTSPEDLIQTMVIEDPELSLWAVSSWSKRKINY